jgi:SulP family sulfate permease
MKSILDKHYNFSRVEFAGSLGDLGTLIPLSVAMIVLNGLNTTSVFLMVALFYIASGLYYKLPIPVQPLKVVAATAIASPMMITTPIIMAASILIGIILVLLAFTGLIDWLARIFSKSIIRGIQLGLGFILITRGIEFISKPELFINKTEVINSFTGLPLNTLIGIISVLIVIFLISNKRFPAALVIVSAGIFIGIVFGTFQNMELSLGIVPIEFIGIKTDDFISAFVLLVIPQIPLTIGNAIIGTSDTCISIFGKEGQAQKVTHKNLSVGMGFVNILAGIIGAIPLCHGAGGLAAHYRFGARTGGSNIMIGLIFLVIAIFFGKIGISLLSTIPYSVLGTLLLFAGLELSLLIRDVKDKKDMFIVFLVAGIGFAATNMGIAVIAGLIITKIINWKRIQI